MKVPQRLSQKVLIPAGEFGVAGYRIQPRESDIQILIIEMVEIEVGRRCVLEVSEPFVDKAPEVVGVRRRQTEFWLEAVHLRLVVDNGSRFSGHSSIPLSMFAWGHELRIHTILFLADDLVEETLRWLSSRSSCDHPSSEKRIRRPGRCRARRQRS